MKRHVNAATPRHSANGAPTGQKQTTRTKPVKANLERPDDEAATDLDVVFALVQQPVLQQLLQSGAAHRRDAPACRPHNSHNQKAAKVSEAERRIGATSVLRERSAVQQSAYAVRRTATPSTTAAQREPPWPQSTTSAVERPAERACVTQHVKKRQGERRSATQEKRIELQLQRRTRLRLAQGMDFES
jgi:hypothetical protein